MYRTFLRITVVFLITFAILPFARAQNGGMLAPPEITGEVVYIPFNVAITLDGDLSDWANVPVQMVDRGPLTSLNPAENGSFSFAVAADSANFYIYMTMRDQNIITGQHGTNFWNEDSLEFYLNLTGDLFRTDYTDGVFQVNINPGDIGNTDPTAITVTGVRGTASGVQAIVFATSDGWGFEAAVPVASYITPSHGLEIGFQAQANGASTANRDVKLIWSLADTADNSYQNPSLFGRGLFFEIGRTDIPQPSERQELPELIVRDVSVNQLGYYPNAPKRAVFSDDRPSSFTWTLVSAETSEIVAAGITTRPFFDEASGSTVHGIDFSRITTPGAYRLLIDGVLSAEFEISDTVYRQLKNDALYYFYLNRAGIELTPELAGQWARAAGHLTDNNVTCYKGRDLDGNDWPGCDYTLDASKGWYDAGDYGKYVVNGGISVWTLMNLYERSPSMFGDGSLRIPENNNGIPDLLDETRWEMEFLLAMQVPDGYPQAGMVHHKLHDVQWAGIPELPPTEYDNDNGHTDPNRGRYVYVPTTAATLNLAATAAQCARLWKDYDAAFAERCLMAAEKAWVAANENPIRHAGRTPGAGGGDYPDGYIYDEFYWAAAELYITTGRDEYLDYLTAALQFRVFPGLLNSNAAAMYWGDTAALGTISLAMVPNGLPEDEIARLRSQITRTADRYLDQINREGYRVPIPSPAGYVWGSNSVALNNALIIGLAYDFTGEEKYLWGVVETMDYILGRNALARSFVSGYGEKTMEHPHHRFWGNDSALGFPPPPPGALAGGPNAEPSDPAALNAGVLADAPAKRYVDLIGSFSTNEVAINWNAPLAWVAAFLDGELGR